MNNNLFLLIVILILFVSGCSSVPSATYKSNVDLNTDLYLDSAFENANDFVVETPQQIFAVDDEMRKMVKFVLDPEPDHAKKAHLLLEYIFSSEHIDLSYAHSENSTAVDTFHGSKANCISLTIMAYTLARQAGMHIDFQNIQVPEYWVRDGNHQLLLGHVNLVISTPSNTADKDDNSRKILEVDFDPTATESNFHREIISKNIILAMFYNNKAAQALVSSEYDKAYAYLKASTRVAPGFYNAWGNLGILYKLNQQYDLAIQSYEYALALNPQDTNTLENLARLYFTLGKVDESRAIFKKIHKQRLTNPYYYAALANDAAYKNKHDIAIKYLKKAIELEPKYHSFYYDLAKLYYKKENIVLAKAAIKKALKLNDNKKTESEYNQKLHLLQQASISY